MRFLARAEMKFYYSLTIGHKREENYINNDNILHRSIKSTQIFDEFTYKSAILSEKTILESIFQFRGLEFIKQRVCILLEACSENHDFKGLETILKKFLKIRSCLTVDLN